MQAKEKLTVADKIRAGAKEVDIVSDDRNWRSYIWNELKCAEGWQKDWGFLSDNVDANTVVTREEKIKKLEEELKVQRGKSFTTTSMAYGTGATLERFFDKKWNKTRSEDIKPIDRRPPKKK